MKRQLLCFIAVDDNCKTKANASKLLKQAIKHKSAGELLLGNLEVTGVEVLSDNRRWPLR